MTVTNSTLAAGSGQLFSSSGTATLTLYHVQNEDVGKSNSLILMPLPRTDSNKKLAYDVMGTSRVFNISGTFGIGDFSNVAADMAKYVQDLVGINTTVLGTGNTTLLNGAQGLNPSGVQSGYVYTSEALNYGRASNITTNVFVDEVKVFRKAGDPNQYTYSMVLYECDPSKSA